MKAIKFKHANVNFAENQNEYKTLPALRFGDENDTIVTCWGLSFRERLKILFTGKLWMIELNFKRSLTPRRLTVKRKEAYTTKEENE